MWHPHNAMRCTSLFFASLHTFHLIWWNMVGEIGLVIFNLFMDFRNAFRSSIFREKTEIGKFFHMMFLFYLPVGVFFSVVSFIFFLYFVIQLEFQKQTAVFRVSIWWCANEVRVPNGDLMYVKWKGRENIHTLKTQSKKNGEKYRKEYFIEWLQLNAMSISVI